MSKWKVMALAVVLGAVLWLLYPWRGSYPGVDSKDVVEIYFARRGGPLEGPMGDVVSQFEQESEAAHARDPSHPIYRVICGQNANRSQETDPTRFVLSVAGGMPPDVIMFDRYAITEWAFRGAFTPLDDYIQRDLAAGLPDVPKPEDFYPACWKEVLYQGRPYGIPIETDSRALYYNRDMFVRHGLVDDNGEARPPRDWDELREFARRLTERDEQGRIKVLGFAPLFGGGPGGTGLYMYGFLNGGDFTSPDGRRCTLNDPRIVEALRFIVDVYDDAGGYTEVSGFQAGFQGGMLNPFLQGKVAMVIDGPWVLNYNIAFYAPNFNFGMAPPPVSRAMIAAGHTTATWSGGFGYTIPSNARHKDAAWDLIKFLSRPKTAALMTEINREAADSQGRPFLPPMSAQKAINERLAETYVYSNPRIDPKIKDGTRVLNDLLAVARCRPATPVGQLLGNEQLRAAETAMYHTMTPEEALERGAAVVQRDLDRVLNPPKGPRLHVRGLIGVYAVLLILVGFAVYYWDTHLGFRRRVAKLLRLRKTTQAVVEGSRGGYMRRQWVGGVVCALPWMVGFIVFGGGPMLFSLVMSFCDYDILNPPRFIGLQNYVWLFTEDALFPKALLNTLFMVVGVPIHMVAGLSVAMLLNLRIRGIAIWRTFFYLPSIVPMVASSILWVWIFNPQGGLINSVLRIVGVQGPLWLQSPLWSKPSLILMGLWHAGGGMIIWLAGLKGIDEQLYEAASIDGASAWQKFLHVTLPQLTPYIFFNLVMGLIGTFQIFGQAFIMTQGGPANSTMFYVYYLFNQAFRYGHMGYASAMAWFLLAIVLALTIFQFKMAKRWVHYESD